ncbi:MAG: CBS domain-containing protein [Myxococcales bacterium]|nr:CBS domain-containing protein [Myxococcales bacterium]
MLVQDVMTKSPVVVQHDTPLVDAMALLQESNIRHLPILEGSALIGMVSDRDLRGVFPSGALEESAMRALSGQYRAPVSELMSADVLYIHPEDDLGEAIDLMLQQNVGAIPVTDPFSGNLVGIVSYVDILKAARNLVSE